jgi:tRNA (guanine-N7-)-methyltransferase
LLRVHAALEPGGHFVVQTDNAPYWRYLQGIVGYLFDFHEQPGPWPDAPQGRTRREIVATQRGLPIFRGWGEAKATVDTAAIAKLPLPRFHAGPRRKDVDARERGEPGAPQ